MPEFKLLPKHKDYALSKLMELKGNVVYIVSQKAGKPVRVDPKDPSKVYAGGGLGKWTQWKCKKMGRKITWGGQKQPVMGFQSVACGKWLAIKNGIVTTGGGGEHCEFIIANVNKAVVLRKAINPENKGVGCNPSGKMNANNVPIGPGPAGAPGRFFIFDADIVKANAGMFVESSK